MKMNHSHHQPANLYAWRQAQIPDHSLDTMANRFARDLNALVRILVYTGLLARLRQNLTDPAGLAPHLDKMGRLAKNAVRLVRQLRKSCVLAPSGPNPARSDRSHSIPVSPWKVVAFNVNVRRLKSQARTRPAPQVPVVRINPRATFISRC